MAIITSLTRVWIPAARRNHQTTIFLAVVTTLACLGFVAYLLFMLPRLGGGTIVAMPRPEEGTVADGAYINKYFDLSYPLPAGWTKGLAGPAPSKTAYYVLGMLVPGGEQTATIFVAAQDAFFAPRPVSERTAMAVDLKQAMSAIEGITVDPQPPEVAIAGHAFSRVDFSGLGLFRSTWITEIRCHLVSFNLMANNAEQLAALALSLNSLGPAGDRGPGDRDPVCLKDRAGPENLVKKVDPPAVAPWFAPIPVRIIIRADGSVKDVHVIRATAEQRKGIEGALAQWTFKPPEVDGRMAEIETGLLIEFMPGGKVNYLPSDRAQF